MYLEIADKIYFIEGENRGRDPYSNSLLIDDRVKVLIDSGIGPEKIKQVAGDFDLDLVILSHGHEDHIAGNPFFPKARIGVHHLDSAAVREVSHQIRLFGVDNPDMEEFTSQILKDIYQLKDSRVDLEFKDGHQFSLGDYRLEVIHTPGHSAGHCCFNLPDAGILFLADISLSRFGPLYEKVDSNIEQFINSIELIKTIDFEIAVSSHKGVFTDRNEVIAELEIFLDKIFQREELLLHFLERERTLDEIVEEAIIYGSFPEPRAIYSLLEKTMITKHLERLIARGRVAATSRGYIAL